MPRVWRRGPNIDLHHRGDGGGGGARRDTLPANDNDNSQVTTRPPVHQHTSVELCNIDIDTFGKSLLLLYSESTAPDYLLVETACLQSSHENVTLLF